MKNILQLIFALSIIFCSSQVKAQSWSPVSTGAFPTNTSGQIHGISRVSDVKFHPSISTKMYAVSARGGLFISNNAGNTWTMAPGCDPLTNGLRFSSVCVDYNNDQIIYLGTGDLNYYYTGKGVYKSTNGGTTFTASNTGISARLVAEIIIDPSNSNVLLAATDAGVYKSTNAGANWTLKSASNLQCSQMLLKANASTRTVYVSTYSGFYRSTDFGDTWTQVTTGIYVPAGYTGANGIRIAVSPADSNRVYLAMVAKKGTVFQSTDGGSTFAAMKDSHNPNLTAYSNDTTTDGGQGDYNFMLAADPVNADILYLGAHMFWKSTNGGSTWSQLTNWWAELHTDMHWVRVNPYNASEVWTANDGGVWLSTNGGVNWTPKSDGIYGYEIYHGACSPTRRDMISIGTQDNGELFHANGTWYCNRGGDWGSLCQFDYRANSSQVYYLGNAKRADVLGSDQTYGLTQTSINGLSFWRNNTNIACVSDTAVYRTSTLLQATPVWTKISSFNKTTRDVHINVNDSNKVYAIGSDSAIYICNNAYAVSPIFTRNKIHTSTISIGSIATIKGSTNVIYATANSKVYRSADDGNTWTNVSSNLPSVNWVGIVSDEFFSSDELVFIAGGNYVYYKKASQTNWTLFNSSLPVRTNIQDISLYDNGTNQSILRVSEYGRGMWEIPMSQLRAVSSEFIASNLLPCIGDSVQFSDLSNGNTISRTWTFTGGSPSTSTLSNPKVAYASIGTYDVTLTVNDALGNATTTKTAYINTAGSNAAVNEGFENTFLPVNWTEQDANNDNNKWQWFTSTGGFGASYKCAYFNNYDQQTNGAWDEMRTQKIDLNGYNTASLTFDVAYQPYGYPYSDTLEVLISTNCGNTYSQIYIKGGSTLATVGGNNSDAFVPTSSQWRTESISLNGFIGNGVNIAFRNRGRFGNNLYIDNVNLNATVAATAGADKLICKGNTAAIGMSTNTNLNFSWSPAGGLSSSTVSNPQASPTVNTSYILTVTHARSGVIAKDTVMVTVDSVTANATTTAVLCNGGNSGQASVSTTSGIAPFAYLWSNSSSTPTATGLVAGVYTVTITDNAGCSKTCNVNIAQPTLLSATTTNTNTTCGFNNGTANVLASNATPPYTYLWNNGSTSANVSSLAAGTYTVMVNDGNGCTITATSIINPSVAISPNPTQKNLPCFGAKSGVCKAAPTNGVAPYSFLWSTGATIDSIVNLKAGTYTCTITDAAGCTKTQTYTLTQPLQIAIAMSGTPATSPLFNNGTATATPSNGFSPYRYSWNTSPIKTTQTATGLVPGTYVVTVKDNKKCSRNASIVIGTARFGVTDTGEELFVIPNPTSDVISIEISNSVLSGNATFEIIDSKGSVVLMEQSNITSHDFTFSISLAHLPNGIYTLRAKDSKNVFTKTVLLEK